MMTKAPFVSLHNHTSAGSVLDALNDTEELFYRAKELEHPALAITEHGTMVSHYDAYKASQKTGVKLIPGVEAYFAPDLSEKKSNHMVLVPMNEVGYKNLLRLNYESYKLNHPGGNIGSKLMCIKDLIITEFPCLILNETIKLKTILLEMTKYSIGCCFFININHIGF
jgi:DNA polymerase III alpha subunit